MDTWIHQMIRAVARRHVIFWGLAAACLVLFILVQHRYVVNFLQGPFDAGLRELDAVDDVSTTPHYFVRVTGSKAIDTGIQQMTVHKRGGVETSRSVSAAYFVLVVGTRLLVVKSASGPRQVVDGELLSMPASLEREVFVMPGAAAARTRFYPYYLDDGAFRLPGYIAIGVILVFGLLLVKYGRPAWQLRQDVSAHPLLRRVTAWGDPLGSAVEAKRQTASPRYKGSGWLVTDAYLVQNTLFRFDLLRISDLLWAYKRVTKHSVNLIPTGKSYAVVLVCDGGTAQVKAREKTVDAILGFVAGRVPWAVFGYSDERNVLFSKSSADFRAAVEQRRRQWEQQTPAQPDT
jgi:hypothetical protein